jgi:putative sterol carrier protein
VCDDDPGDPVAVTVTASLRRLVQVWRGDLGWPEALRSGAAELRGPAIARRAFPGWFTLPPYTTVTRPA